MELVNLSNKQLIELTEERVFPAIQDELDLELKSREIAMDDYQKIYSELVPKTAKRTKRSKFSLTKRTRIIIVCFPFPIGIYSIISGCLLAKGYVKKHREYWTHINKGLAIHIICSLVLAIIWNRLL